jgi:viologen exporter family transport system permease protein
MRPPSERGGPARLAWLFFRVSTMNEAQYRVNFFVQLAQSMLSLATGLAVLGLVFSHTEELAGWSRPELLAVMGVFTLMGGLITMLIEPNMQRLLEDIRQGNLDFVLTKPQDAQLLISVREIKIWHVVDVASGVVVLTVAVAQLRSSVGIGESVAFAVMLLLGGTMIYSFWLILATGAFWLVRMDEVRELFQGVFRAGQYPIAVYPGWLRIGLTFLVPLAFAVTVPAEAITSRLDWPTVVLTAVVAAVIFGASRLFFRLGLRRYSGASA